jgi:hypothetical protein
VHWPFHNTNYSLRFEIFVAVNFFFLQIWPFVLFKKVIANI